MFVIICWLYYGHLLLLYSFQLLVVTSLLDSDMVQKKKGDSWSQTDDHFSSSVYSHGQSVCSHGQSVCSHEQSVCSRRQGSQCHNVIGFLFQILFLSVSVGGRFFLCSTIILDLVTSIRSQLISSLFVWKRIRLRYVCHEWGKSGRLSSINEYQSSASVEAA